MKIRMLAAAFLLATAPVAVLAANVSCPILTAAQQAGTCPTEEDLLFTFNGYCSDNARIYGKGAEVCTDYQLYRKMKNIVLWEVPKTGFEGYVSCDIPAGKLKTLKPVTISASKQGKMSRLACGYEEGVTFTYRTREECRIDSAEACKTDPAACKANCE